MMAGKMPDGTRYPDDVRVEALALVAQVGNMSEVARILKEKYPDRAPSNQTVSLWLQEHDPAAFDSLGKKKAELLRHRAADVALAAADKLEEGIASGEIKGQPLGVVFGISSDKVLKGLELDRGGGGFRMFAAMVQRRAQKMLDGSDTETQEIIAVEGRME